MTSFNARGVITLAKIAIAAMAVASASAFATALRPPQYDACPATPASLRDLTDQIVASDASEPGSDPACFSGLTAKWDERVWPAMLAMLGSHDQRQIGVALKMLGWRADVATRHADVLPALLAVLADPATPPQFRRPIKSLILVFGERALVALPLFMAHAADAQAGYGWGEGELFVELVQHSAAPLEHVIALLDSDTATLDAMMAAAGRIGVSIPGSSQAAPALRRTIERTRTRARQLHDTGRVAGLLDAYLASEDPAAAVSYLITLRARTEKFTVFNEALDSKRHAPDFNARLVALFDQPALAAAAASALGGQRSTYQPEDDALAMAVPKLKSMLADPAAVPTALECIRAIDRRLPALAAPVFSYYQSLAKHETGKRVQALRALEVSGGLSEQQFLYLANQTVQELRAASPPRTGRMMVAPILRVLRTADPLPASSLTPLVSAVRLARQPGPRFTPEQLALMTLIGNARSAAGTEALVRLLPPTPPARPLPLGWYTDTDAVLGALARSGDGALPGVERQLERASGIQLAMLESMLASIDTPAAKALLARHAARVGPGLLSMLDAPAPVPAAPMPAAPIRRGRDGSDTQYVGIYCHALIPESALAVAIFRIGRLRLATTEQAVGQLALGLDAAQPDVRACAVGAILAVSDETMARRVIGQLAAIPGRKSAQEMLSKIIDRDERYH